MAEGGVQLATSVELVKRHALRVRGLHNLHIRSIGHWASSGSIIAADFGRALCTSLRFRILARSSLFCLGGRQRQA